MQFILLTIDSFVLNVHVFESDFFYIRLYSGGNQLSA